MRTCNSSILLKHIFTIGLCLVVLTALVGWVTAEEINQEIYFAGTLAVLVVWASASIALVVTVLSIRGSSEQGNSNNSIVGILLAMLIRMGLPLLALLVIQHSGGSLYEAGFSGLLLCNYFLALALETMLSLKWLSSGSQDQSTCLTLEAPQTTLR